MVDYQYNSPDYAGARWSFHLARPPAFLAGADASVINWFKNRVYDRSDVDPNAELARIEQAYRTEAARLGVRAAEDSASVLLAAAELELGLTTWQQIAGSAGSATPSGEGALSAPILDVISASDQERIRAFREAVTISGGDPDKTDANVLAILGPSIQPATRSVNPAPVIVSPTLATPVGLGDRNPAAFGDVGPVPLSAPMYAPAPLGGGGGGGVSPLILVALVGAAVYFMSQKKP